MQGIDEMPSGMLKDQKSGHRMEVRRVAVCLPYPKGMERKLKGSLTPRQAMH